MTEDDAETLADAIVNMIRCMLRGSDGAEARAELQSQLFILVPTWREFFRAEALAKEEAKK